MDLLSASKTHGVEGKAGVGAEAGAEGMAVMQLDQICLVEGLAISQHHKAMSAQAFLQRLVQCSSKNGLNLQMIPALADPVTER